VPQAKASKVIILLQIGLKTSFAGLSTNEIKFGLWQSEVSNNLMTLITAKSN